MKGISTKYLQRGLPSLRMAIIKTMKGEKSNFQINAMNMKPNCIQAGKNNENP
jgi:N-dimethylarginine dimethylaminohydrolase